MKYLVVILLFGLFACNSENSDDSELIENTQEVEQLIVEEGNSFKEYYPGKKQLKMEGVFDSDKKRHGIWKFYTEEGVAISITEFQHGLRSGLSMVYFPTGKLNYKGEYRDDKPIGTWQIYDAKTGKLKSEKNYDEQ